MQKTERKLSPIEEVIADARAGRMFILVDDITDTLEHSKAPLIRFATFDGTRQ